MSKPIDSKSQYVDVSYGWQNREEAKRLQHGGGSCGGSPWLALAC